MLTNYLYLCDYQDEKREKVNEYKSVVPKSPVTSANDTLNSKIEQFHNAKIEAKSKSFFQKLFAK